MLYGLERMLRQDANRPARNTNLFGFGFEEIDRVGTNACKSGLVIDTGSGGGWVGGGWEDPSFFSELIKLRLWRSARAIPEF